MPLLLQKQQGELVCAHSLNCPPLIYVLLTARTSLARNVCWAWGGTRGTQGLALGTVRRTEIRTRSIN